MTMGSSVGQGKFGLHKAIATLRLVSLLLGTPGETSASIMSSKKSTRTAAYRSLVLGSLFWGNHGICGHRVRCHAWNDRIFLAWVASPFGFRVRRIFRRMSFPFSGLLRPRIAAVLDVMPGIRWKILLHS